MIGKFYESCLVYCKLFAFKSYFITLVPVCLNLEESLFTQENMFKSYILHISKSCEMIHPKMIIFWISLKHIFYPWDTVNTAAEILWTCHSELLCS